MVPLQSPFLVFFSVGTDLLLCCIPIFPLYLAVAGLGFSLSLSSADRRLLARSQSLGFSNEIATQAVLVVDSSGGVQSSSLVSPSSIVFQCRIEAFESILGQHVMANHLDQISIVEIEQLVNKEAAYALHKAPDIIYLGENAGLDQNYDQGWNHSNYLRNFYYVVNIIV
ncbi:DNA replication licensing factor MCM 1 [Canna indica]|uniref:DNA replication licensing factor MCM 1 n=1 Tax=Canna indica TaxID=4628 RepID=A0AAQ3QJL0_9LILI|nr:DNA replication licensing factor MCM 1 [Canna indica]